MGGRDGPKSPLTTVEMLQCPWNTEETVNSEWRYVAPMHHARDAHGVVYFKGKLIAAGGVGRDSVEYFTLPTDEAPEGQWVIIRPMIHAKELLGILPFGEVLLFVGKCFIVFFIQTHFCILWSHPRGFSTCTFASLVLGNNSKVKRNLNRLSDPCTFFRSKL